MKNGVADTWEDPALLDAVAKDLSAVVDEDAPETEPTPEPTDDGQADETESTTGPEGDVAEKEPSDSGESTPESASDEPAGDEDRPAIPDNHYRAAIHMGMKPEEISELYDADPKLALKTLAKCHEMTNAASRQLGELGQAMRRANTTATPAVTTTPAADGKRAKLEKLLKEKYADDPVVDTLLELLPQDAPAPAPTQAHREAPAPAVQWSIDEEVAIRQQIGTFFADPDLEPYTDFYGSAKDANGSMVGTVDHLTPGQKANRTAMLERAQLILEGANALGTKLSVAEAMERAHLEVSAPMAETVVRERIKSSLVKRAKGVTLKPSAGKNLSGKTGGYDAKEHQKAVAAELKSVFG
jgi:hypothetical protein